MLHFSRWKILAIVLTCLAGLIATLPNFFPKEKVQAWPTYVPKKQMNLGLDLQGGAHLLLAMDQEEIKKDWMQNLRDSARRAMRDAKIGYSAFGIQGTQLTVRLTKPEDREAALKELRKLIQPIGNAILGTSGFDLAVSEAADPAAITVSLTDQGLKSRVSNAAEASIATIDRRINSLGTSESSVVRQGSDRILIQFPGLQDTAQLKKLIGDTAKLTFHEVHKTMSAADAKLTTVPPGYKIYPGDKGEDAEFLLLETPTVPGDDLVDAQPGFDQQNGGPVIHFRFNQSGARKFGAYTKDNVGQRFAIVLDDKVISAPVIQTAILGGSGQISGNFTVEQTNTLAVQLRSGALPTKLTIVEERTVGPSLGADSISAGKTAGIIGGLAVIALTVLAYGTFGMFAVIGLLVHLLLTVALMTVIGSTLTLPGIAGLVLGVAMAVDANVLIYERIREELRAGKTPISAIDAGFQRAFITIADSQLTTLACALIMFWLGSGPIRGFAVTLTIVEERTVGPSLGADSISAGKTAGIIGGLAVIVLTVLAYGTFGIFAVVGLLVHLLLTVALMTVIGSTLTLPGIAGLVLGVAMAVDANVLIYERIREELRAGKTPISAIDSGFQRAFITIADSQLTTLACALIMFWLGSGPIRGFAVTLTIGILTSIFASVTVVRLLIWYWIKAQPKGKPLSIPV